MQADATAWRPDAPFAAVLLDAPCSATGTISRHPDMPYLKRPRDIAALTGQREFGLFDNWSKVLLSNCRFDAAMSVDLGTLLNGFDLAAMSARFATLLDDLGVAPDPTLRSLS